MNYLSICSGIEAASSAWHPLGWRAVAFSEIEEFPSKVLRHHYPDVPNLGDFTAIDATKLGAVDVLVGGTPCQAFSLAGARLSLADARGNLTLSFVRLAHDLADRNGLRNAVWENVPGVLSTKDNAFGCFLGGLVGSDHAIPTPRRGEGWPSVGMVAGPKGRAAWRVLDAQFFGVAQRRRRVFVVADFGAGADPAAVLFERAGLHRDRPTRGEERQDVAPTLAARTRGGGGKDHIEGDGGLVIANTVLAGGNSNNPLDETLMVSPPAGSVTIMAHGQGGAEINVDHSPTLNCNHEAPIAFYQTCATGDVTHTLSAEGADASEDGTGRGVPIVNTTTRGPCVKQRVVATVVTTDGRRFVGENDCLTAQVVCPRADMPTGVGYELCQSVCHQTAHAEVNALANAGAAAVGATIYVEGHTYACDSCKAACAAAGVVDIVIGSPPMAHAFDARQSDVIQYGDMTGPLDTDGHTIGVLCFSSKDHGADAANDIAPTLRAGGHTTSHQNGGCAPAIAYSVALRGRDGGATAELGGDLSGTLRASGGGGDKAHVLTDAVRRLTPRECERLQGFPDDHTKIPLLNKHGKRTGKFAADAPRYKALGNSMAVPVMAWIGQRIAERMPVVAANDHAASAVEAA